MLRGTLGPNPQPRRQHLSPLWSVAGRRQRRRRRSQQQSTRTRSSSRCRRLLPGRSAPPRRNGRPEPETMCGRRGWRLRASGDRIARTAVIPSRRMTACEGRFSTAVIDQIWSRPALLKPRRQQRQRPRSHIRGATDHGRAAGLPPCHPLQVRHRASGSRPVNPMNCPPPATLSAHNPNPCLRKRFLMRSTLASLATRPRVAGGSASQPGRRSSPHRVPCPRRAIAASPDERCGRCRIDLPSGQPNQSLTTAGPSRVGAAAVEPQKRRG